MENLKEVIKGADYDFLRTNEYLGDKIMLLAPGGSHAYGTNIPTSDVDIRGITMMRPDELLTNRKFDQFTDDKTDTVIYGFNKMISLLSNCNPNTIEILGLKPEQYIYLSDMGQELLNNKKLFLSKKAVNSFGGYANQQLQRLNNKAVREVGQAERENHILKTILYAGVDFPTKYWPYEEGNIRLYVDWSKQEGYDTEIYMDLNLNHYPLRDWAGMWNEMKDIARSYGKLGKRNKRAADRGKLAKHMMHLVRLYLMAFDILETEEIVTYREKDHDFLMSIRNGLYLDKKDKVRPEFFELVEKYEKRLTYDAENTSLPEAPDYDAINDLMMKVNRQALAHSY